MTTFEQAQKYLLDAASGKEQADLTPDNPFREVGFDSGKKRLGWARQLPISMITESLTKIQDYIARKKYFLFIGMGGSINGIKPLLSLYVDQKKIYTLDSLDPAALDQVLNAIGNGNLADLLVIPISKSGTTKETQLLAQTLRSCFKENWQNQFLWLADPDSFEKIKGLGWDGCPIATIQCDQANDIGGRFSCPHTMVFALPLFILLNNDIALVQHYYESFYAQQPHLRQQAFSLAQQYKDESPAYFSPIIDAGLKPYMQSWLAQLFQESLGSKKDGVQVKTFVTDDEIDPDFIQLQLGLTMENKVIDLMGQMYFFQMFVGFFAAFNGINFVDQPYVEIYKKEMRKLEGTQPQPIEVISIDELIEIIKARLQPQHKFIDVVLYYHPQTSEEDLLMQRLSTVFSQHRVFIFIGSDWNHHSYQAAGSDQHTLFILLCSESYNTSSSLIKPELLRTNSQTMQLIARATYNTITNKAVLKALRRY